MRSLLVSDLRFAAANPALRSKGLLGWANLSLDGKIQLDCLAVRRTVSGEIALSFPSRTDASGVMHPYYMPLDDEIRRAIESQVIGELRARGVLP